MTVKGVSSRRRIVVLFVLFLIVFITFLLILMQMQIVEGKSYSDTATRGSTRVQTIQAARGEIVDRYGRPLASNRVGFNITFDRAFLPYGGENEVILKLFELLDAAGESWIDHLPLTDTAPFTFKEGYENETAVLKKHLGLASFATAEDVVYWLKERYHLQEANDFDFRRAAGVRYEMERRGFNLSTRYTFAEDVSISTVSKIKEQSSVFLGVAIEENPIREYVNGDLASPIIGDIGPIYKEEYESLKELGYGLNDVVGKSGIERQYESTLRGENGTRQITLDAQGNVIDVVALQEPKPGNTVVLTLDKQLQSVLQQALKTRVEQLRATSDPEKGQATEGASAVVIDVKTGDILASATYPTYDLATYRQNYNEIKNEPFNPLINRALTGLYAPGSTFKPSVAVAALAENFITDRTTVFCGGHCTLFPDYQPRCMGFHRNINVINALRVSCNVFFYETGYKLGIDLMNRYASLFGLGEYTGIELYEAKGQISNPSVKGDWTQGDIIQTAIGQSETLVTPLQLAVYTATIANKGVQMQPHFVKEIKSYTFEETIEETFPTVKTDLNLDRSIFSTITQGMVLASGANGTSGSTFINYPISVASKTGTPETGTIPNSVYIAFAPADDPQIAVAIVLEKAWHGTFSAPVAKAVFDEYFFSDTVDQSSPYAELLP